MCTMSSLAAAILWWGLKPSFLSCMTSSRNSMTVPPSAVWARTSLAMRSSSTAESTVRRSSVNGPGAFRVAAAGAFSSPEQGSAGTRRPRVEWPQGTPRYLAMNLAASFDPYFTSCLAASILWHSSAPSILSSMTSRKKSMMRRPSSVFSRTMSASVGGFRSSAVVSAWGPLVSDMCSIMWEDWVVVKGEFNHNPPPKPTFPISTLQGLPQSAMELPNVAE